MDYATAFFKALDMYGLEYRFNDYGSVDYLFDIEEIPADFDQLVESLVARS